MFALLLVDLQNDFMPGGALAVPDGDAVIAPANRLAAHMPLVVATQDWHPADHASFAVNHPGRRVGEIITVAGKPQMLWPVHCVQGTAGAGFHRALEASRVQVVIRKGTDPAVDSYSGFFDNDHRSATGLEARLREHGVTAVAVLGLATDYCVKFTALDAARLGFEVTLVTDACRAVNVTPGDGGRAVEEMRAAGVMCCTSDELLQRLHLL